MFLYQQNRRYFAQVAEGLEEEAVSEIRRLGGRDPRPIRRGVHFEADQPGLYRVNYMARLITRVLAPLALFPCRSTDMLYRQVKALPWEALLAPEQTIAVFANVVASDIRHSQHAALCVKDAVVDHFREACGRRPDVARIDPDLWINLYIEKNRAAVSLDASGGSLHRRGYRREGLAAPMQETVAAAVIRWTGWEGAAPLVDPMCGSGTLLAEALMHAGRIPAGYLRPRFGFERLPDFDRRRWLAVKAEADAAIREIPAGRIAGSDISAAAVEAARGNLARLPGGDRIAVARCDWRRIERLEGRIIVTNPPHGIRLSPRADLSSFYAEFGDFLKRRCRGSTAFVYFGEREWIKRIGLRPAWKRPLKNGGLDGRLVRFDLY
jgi:putative N6-adenine-specific DNA methylase